MNLSTNQLEYISAILNSKNLNINTLKNKLIKTIFSDNNISEAKEFDIYQLTDILTFDFGTEARKKNGITFTPLLMVEFMYQEVYQEKVESYFASHIADISMGNGAFFAGLILYLKKQNPNFSVVDFLEKNIYGYDIQKENIEFAKLCLSLLAIYFNEDVEEIHFNFMCVDSVQYYLDRCFTHKFDLIVGNPPYVKQQNIDKSYRLSLEKNFSTIASNYNLYYAFIEIATSIISKSGRILLLVPNYLLKIKSAQTLREFLLTNSYFERAVDFKANKLFTGIDTYSMVMQLKRNSATLSFKTVENNVESVLDLSRQSWESISSQSLTSETINLVSANERQLISKVSSQLLQLDISTGIATQKDKLYLIDEVHESMGRMTFFKIFDNQKFEIEPEIVIKIIKGSGTSKSAPREQFIIYPYKRNPKPSLIPLDELKDTFPKTLAYFKAVHDELLSRSGDYGKEDWYRYGRSQSLDRDMPKIIFPTNSDVPKFKYFEDKALFYNGYAVFGIKDTIQNLKDLKLLEIILNSSLMENFMKLTSYFIGGGYVSYQKKYLEKFTIPLMDDEQKDQLITLSQSKNKKAVNQFIYNLYNLDSSVYKIQ